LSTRTTAPHPLTALEIASGIVVGADPHTPALPAYDGRSARQTLEDAILPALQRQPCVVSFSGGRDSSAMLALAAHVARREGLPAPIAVTLRYPDAPETREDDWQRAVVEHVGITDWECLDITDELDVIGPVAQRALRAHGVLFPFNAHCYLPMFPAADGGSVVTGLDGDGLLDAWMCESAVDVLARRRAPRPRDVLRLGLFAGPQRLRQLVLSGRLKRASSWLTPRAEAASRRADARELAEEPMRWDRRVHWWHARRHVSLATDALNTIAGAAGVHMSHPLLDPAFLAALAYAGGRYGLGGRTAVMRMLLFDLLPDRVLARDTKATFDSAFFNRHSREFARGWDGGSIDPELVDADRLRAAWLRPQFPLDSAMLLQATWLATVRAGR
jgi:asparagine synthase (glutamine-hydrolysing)